MELVKKILDILNSEPDPQKTRLLAIENECRLFRQSILDEAANEIEENIQRINREAQEYASNADGARLATRLPVSQVAVIYDEQAAKARLFAAMTTHMFLESAKRIRVLQPKEPK